MSGPLLPPEWPPAPEIAELDRRHVWHPFTQHSVWNRRQPLIIVRGEREFLIDAGGRRYIDGHSSLWCNIHGHNHPHINRAITDQLGRLAHSTLLGLTSPPAVLLARRLVEIAPPGLSRVFFSDDGSTAVEVACKMAYAYWHHTGYPGRCEFVALRNAYHGDTLGAVSVGGIDLFHGLYRPLLFTTHFVPPPYCYRCELGRRPDTCGLACAEEVDRVLRERAGRVAAVVLEPRMQCAGGMIAAPAGYLRRVAAICRAHDVLLIADEVATGFGRTGRMFACEHEGISPDLLCVSKGLTGGYLPLAATLAADRIYEAFLGPVDSGRTFYHGHTFTGNALACAAALANLELFDRENTLEALAPKIERMRRGLERIAAKAFVGDVRQCGMLAGIELVADKAARTPFPYGRQIGAQVCARAVGHGVILRPLADVIVLVPPLSIAMESLDRLIDVVDRCIDEVLIEGRPGAVDGLE